MQPLVVYSVGSFASRLASFWFLTGIGLAIAVVVYALLCHPRFRRGKYRALPAVRPAKGLVFALPVLLAFTGVGHLLNFQGFFGFAMYSDRLELRYRFPDREVTVTAAEVDRFEQGLTMSKGDERSLIVVLVNGDQHESVAGTARHHATVLQDLRDWLAKARS